MGNLRHNLMNRAILLAVALVLVSAPAAATWYGPGTVEPDTSYDQEQTLMHADPPTKDGQVYFNTYAIQWAGNINPNSGALGTHTTAPIIHIQAMLGVWKDCNGDGYIGHYEHGLSEYREELMLAGNPCANTIHTSGAWVYEFLYLGPDNVDADGNVDAAYNSLNATGVKIWGDVGEPGDEPGFSCPLRPSAGSTSRTGTLIRWADCPSGKSVANTLAFVDSDGSLGLAFRNCVDNDGNAMTDDQCRKNPQYSDSALNQESPVSLWGNPYTDENGLLESGSGTPAFTAWDCSSEPASTVSDPTGGSLHNIGVEDPTGGLLADENGHLLVTVNVSDENGVIHNVYPIAFDVASPTGSYVDGANQTERGALWNCGEQGWEEDSTLGETFEASTFSEILGTNPEGTLESQGQSATGKNEVGSWFRYFDGTDFRAAKETVGQTSVHYGEEITNVTGEDTPRNLGVHWGLRTQGSPRWSSSTIITSEEFYVSPEAGPVTKRYFTFYASILPEHVTAFGDLQLQLPGGTDAGIYGSDNCGTSIGTDAPTKNGWACDPALWYINNAGKDYDPEGIMPRVGDTYSLRDVDCFNGLPILPPNEMAVPSWC